jgi:hypothetical protein
MPPYDGAHHFPLKDSGRPPSVLNCVGRITPSLFHCAAALATVGIFMLFIFGGQLPHALPQNAA